MTWPAGQRAAGAGEDLELNADEHEFEGADDYQTIAAALAYLEANQQRQPTLEELAAHLAISPFHLQRLFKRWAGISPKRFVQFLTVEHAKELLARSHNLLQAAYETGLSGPGRLHDLFVSVEAMTPGEFKLGGRGLTIRYGFHPTPFGECLLAVTARGVCGLNFVGMGGRDGELEALRARWPAAILVENPAETGTVAAQIFGAPRTLDASSPPMEQAVTQWRGQPPGTLAGPEPGGLRLLLAGTNFQIKVWEALLRIPPGSVCTYEDVAASIGQPSAARAVGGAVGANSIAYLIPCHRVIRKSGVFREYRWGETRKRAMIGWEAARGERNERVRG
jgi:AraC family transcriptional regulator of adaptative response/methylated-DNA-[protein]-cysteine methyltransferase